MQSAICTGNQTTELTRESPVHPRPLRASGFVQQERCSEGEARTFDCTFWLNKPGELR